MNALRRFTTACALTLAILAPAWAYTITLEKVVEAVSGYEEVGAFQNIAGPQTTWDVYVKVTGTIGDFPGLTLAVVDQDQTSTGDDVLGSQEVSVIPYQSTSVIFRGLKPGPLFGGLELNDLEIALRVKIGFSGANYFHKQIVNLDNTAPSLKSTPINPTDGGRLAASTPTLSWQVDGDQFFTTKIELLDGPTRTLLKTEWLRSWESSYSLPSEYRTNSRAFFWRVTVYDKAGNSSSSPDWRFSVDNPVTRVDLEGEGTSAPENSTLQFAARAYFSDGSNRLVTTDPSTTWTPTPSTYASVSNGLLTAKSVTSNQTVDITASYGGKTSVPMRVTITDQVIPVTVSSLSIDGGGSSMPENSSLQFLARALMSDRTYKIVTSDASWGFSSPTNYASISGGNLVSNSVTSNQNVTITASYAGISAIPKPVTITDQVSPPAVETVTPPDAPQLTASQIFVGEEAVITLSNATSTMGHGLCYKVDWGDGFITPGWSGQTIFRHAYSASTGSDGFKIVAQAACADHFANGIISQPSTPAYVSVTSKPLDWSYRITGPVPPEVREFSSANLQCFRDIVGGGSQDVTDFVTWSVDHPESVSISNGSLSAGGVPGDQPIVVTATSSQDGRQARYNVKVKDETYSTTPPAIQVSGALEPNQAVRYFAPLASAGTSFGDALMMRWMITRERDGQVIYDSDWTSYSSQGVVYPIAEEGTYKVSYGLACGNIMHRLARLGLATPECAKRIVTIAKPSPPTVTVTMLTIFGRNEPATLVLQSGYSTEYVCGVTYSDGTLRPENAEWSIISGGLYARFDGNRLTALPVTSNQPVTIQASFGGKTQTLSVTIKPIPVTVISLSIEGGGASLPESGSLQFTAIATFSDKTTRDVTKDPAITWSASPAYASISAGMLTASSVDYDQEVIVTASYGGQAAPPKTVTIIDQSIASAQELTVTRNMQTVDVPQNDIWFKFYIREGQKFRFANRGTFIAIYQPSGSPVNRSNLVLVGGNPTLSPGWNDFISKSTGWYYLNAVYFTGTIQYLDISPMASLIVTPPSNDLVAERMKVGSVPSCTFTIKNTGTSDMVYIAQSPLTFLKIEPSSASVLAGRDQMVTATLTNSSSPVGDYSTTIMVNAAGASGSPQTIDVKYRIVNPLPVPGLLLPANGAGLDANRSIELMWDAIALAGIRYQVKVGAAEWKNVLTPRYEIPAQTLPNGTYEWSVRAVTDFQTGIAAAGRTFSINQTSDRTDSDNSFDQAVRISDMSNPGWYGVLAFAGDEDFTIVKTHDAGAMTVQLGDLPCNYDLYIYDAARNEVGHSSNAGTSDERITVPVASGQEFYVRVMAPNREFNGQQRYTVMTFVDTRPPFAIFVTERSLSTQPGGDEISVRVTGPSLSAGDQAWANMRPATGGTWRTGITTQRVSLTTNESIWRIKVPADLIKPGGVEAIFGANTYVNGSFNANPLGPSGSIFLPVQSSWSMGPLKTSRWYLVRFPGVPVGATTQVFADAMGGFNSRWSLYRIGLNGLGPEVKSSEPIAADDAFWLLTLDDNRTIRAEVPAATPSKARITLRQGWNVVSSPLLQAIAWKRVRVEVGVNLYTPGSSGAAEFVNTAVYAWNPDAGTRGDYVRRDASDLKPGEPCWIKAYRACTLVLDPSAAIAAQAVALADDGKWELAITAEVSGIAEKPSLVVGASSMASDGYDGSDLIAAPGSMSADTLRLLVKHGDWQGQSGAFCQDLRSASVDARKIWHLSLDASTRAQQRVTIRWTGKRPSTGYVYLVNRAANETVPMNSQAEYSFTMSTSTQDLEIVWIATAQEVRVGQSVSSTFTGFEVQPYPNPTREGWAKFRIKSGASLSSVRVELYTIAGEAVSRWTAYSPPLAGVGQNVYDVLWNCQNEHGMNVASGFYLFYVRGLSMNGQPAGDQRGKLCVIRSGTRGDTVDSLSNIEPTTEIAFWSNSPEEVAATEMLRDAVKQKAALIGIGRGTPLDETYLVNLRAVEERYSGTHAAVEAKFRRAGWLVVLDRYSEARELLDDLSQSRFTDMREKAEQLRKAIEGLE